ncbi:MAG: hypothetical protein ABIJ97_15365 [Bacteroidota bacterium]
MKPIINVFYILLFTFSVARAQEGIIRDPERKKQYEKIINQANKLFNNKQYSASIHFYKNALELAPEKKLAKYRLEDIKTIFIKEELADNLDDAEILINKIDSTLNEIAKNLPEEKKDSLIFFIADIAPKKAETVDNRPKDWIEMENSVRKEMDGSLKVVGDEPVGEIIPDNIHENVKDTFTYVPVKKEPVVKKISEPIIVNSQKPQGKTNEELEIEKKKKEEELKIKYPDEKTVEYFEANGKKTTRVVINRNKRISVYLKVEHNWGGVYYFIDNSPFPVQSITSSYFVKNTL